jgi:hypothetical protein
MEPVNRAKARQGVAGTQPYDASPHPYWLGQQGFAQSMRNSAVPSAMFPDRATDLRQLAKGLIGPLNRG